MTRGFYYGKNKICLKTVNGIRDKCFFIPDYQRGYRWTFRQVTDLLTDIDAFLPRPVNDSEKTWYCMQPLIVKKREAEYVVIDGQQRLTTIYLILFYLNSRLLEDEREKLFDLKYQTRIESGRYLKDDDLYIKMNARGKSLSDFENFKATIERIIKSEKWEEPLNDERKKFSFKADTIWTDLLWKYRDKNNNIDPAFYRLMNILILCAFTASNEAFTNRKEAESVIQKTKDQRSVYEYIKKPIMNSLWMYWTAIVRLKLMKFNLILLSGGNTSGKMMIIRTFSWQL